VMCMGEWVNFPFTQQLLTTRVVTLRTSEEHLVERYQGPRTLKDCILSIKYQKKLPPLSGMRVATVKETRNMRTLKEEKNRMLDVCGSNVAIGYTSKTLIVMVTLFHLSPNRIFLCVSNIRRIAAIYSCHQHRDEIQCTSDVLQWLWLCNLLHICTHSLS